MAPQKGLGFMNGIPTEFNGVKYRSQRAACEALGIKYEAFKTRVHKGNSPWEAMNGLLLKKLREEQIIGQNCEKLPLKPYEHWPSGARKTSGK